MNRGNEPRDRKSKEEREVLRKLISQIHEREKGITGLETAIILIAFVVVASVFAYVVLSAGLFSTQKSQEAVYSGLKVAESTLEIKGGLIAKAETTGASGYLSQLTFTLSTALGGEPVNFTAPTPASANTGIADISSNNMVVISYTDQDQRVENIYWTVAEVGSGDNNDLLESDEMFEITIGNDTHTEAGGNMVDALSPDIGVSKSFTIEVKPPTGAVLTFERTTPAYIDGVMNLN